jgi:adenine-specific DNA-methyltransferase
MARLKRTSPKTHAKPDKKPIEQYEHPDKKRKNNPPVGLVTPQTDQDAGKKTYAYDPHLDPQLVWAGKAEHTSFEVPTVSLHVHERIAPRTIIEAVRRKNGAPVQTSLFELPSENPPLRDAIDFYKHEHNWSNRLIAGDSLLVMNSLIEKEGLAGQVQMVYLDPPYGIKYGPNFQPFVNKRDVKDGKDEDLTQIPEEIRAFRDTWELGVHSYLAYLRDRLLLARELLRESGSCFVQISDENVHLVRNLMDETFGVANFVSLIVVKKASPLGSGGLTGTLDFLVWYARQKDAIKFRQLFQARELEDDHYYTFIELEDGSRRSMTDEELRNRKNLSKRSKCFASSALVSSGLTPSCVFPVQFEGRTFNPSTGRSWRTNPAGMENLRKANRLIATGNTLRYISHFDDFPFEAQFNLWSDTGGGAIVGQKIYVVQTPAKVIARCVLMTTDPGDLVFDPTCGSGTTAYVAEQWGRRWITCDTSRVAVTLAKQRLMTALFDYYELAHPHEGVGSGFKYKTVPHITLKSIANN